MRSGLKFAFVLTSGIIALSLLLLAGGAAADTSAQRTYTSDIQMVKREKLYGIKE